MMRRNTRGGRIFLAGAVMFLLWAATAQAYETTRQITVEQRPLAELQAPVSPVRVDVWSNRADGQYIPGETMQLSIRSNADVRVAVLNVDVLGRVTVLLPNSFQPDSLLKANTINMLPADGARFQLKVNEPFGMNLIKVVASTGTHPILDPGALQRSAGPFSQYSGTPGDLARSVQVVMAEQAASAWAVADHVFEVVPYRPGSTPSAGAEDFSLLMQLDGFMYRLGDYLSLRILSNRDCTLTLVNVNRELNEAVVLYPNRNVPTVRLQANRETMLPGANSPVQFAVLGPAGPQSLVALCTESPQPLLGDLSANQHRSVYPVLTPSQWTVIQQEPRIARTSVDFEILQ